MTFSKYPDGGEEQLHYASQNFIVHFIMALKVGGRTHKIIFFISEAKIEKKTFFYWISMSEITYPTI